MSQEVLSNDDQVQLLNKKFNSTLTDLRNAHQREEIIRQMYSMQQDKQEAEEEMQRVHQDTLNSFFNGFYIPVQKFYNLLNDINPSQLSLSIDFSYPESSENTSEDERIRNVQEQSLSLREPFTYDEKGSDAHINVVLGKELTGKDYYGIDAKSLIEKSPLHGATPYIDHGEFGPRDFENERSYYFVLRQLPNITSRRTSIDNSTNRDVLININWIKKINVSIVSHGEILKKV